MLKMLNSQKFLWCLMAFIVGTAMLWLGKIEADHWVGFAKFLSAFAVTANIAGMALHGFAPGKIGSSEK